MASLLRRGDAFAQINKTHLPTHPKHACTNPPPHTHMCIRVSIDVFCIAWGSKVWRHVCRVMCV